MKTIEYYGQTFEVEDKYKFVVADPWGDIYVYVIPPYFDVGYGYHYSDGMFIGRTNKSPFMEI